MIRALIICFIICLTAPGCAATSCATIAIERHDHPARPAPARRYVLKCGPKKVTMDVDKPPACLEACF